MTVRGETDLRVLLREMSPLLHEGNYVYTTVADTIPPGANPVAFVREDEGMTLILRQERADELGLPYGFVAAWITLRVHSALQAVGLTAAISAALAAAGIGANVVAGFHHDHVFVPRELAADALCILLALSAGTDVS